MTDPNNQLNIPPQLPPKKPQSLGGHLSTPTGYTPKSEIPGAQAESQEKLTKEFEKLKSKLDGLKKKICKKYNFTIAMGILPGQAAPLFEEEEQLPPEVTNTKPIHLVLIIPEEQFKNIQKIKPEVLKIMEETKENLWLHIWTPVDVFNFGLDSRFDLQDAIASSFPIYDNGFLGALRVASIHKSLLLRRFDKYIATYGIGGSLVRGTADDTSDVDTFVIIDDTDVKRMPRMELLEKLRGIAYDYIKEATALAGVKNILNVQVWLLTEFWQNVKDAHPVMFTFIRDGIPLHDRGTFLPWKMLLKMGKIKPSSEAIDLFMKQGDQTDDLVKRRMMDSMIDVYYGVLTPSQALVMLYGEPPPTHKETFKVMTELFVNKEKMMTKQEVAILGKAVGLFKDYEHGKLKEISGAEIDKILEDCMIYLKKLKEVRKKIEVYMQKKTSEEIYADLFKMLKTVLGDKSQEALLVEFEKELINPGRMQPRFLKILKDVVRSRSKIKAGKLDQKEADNVKKDALELMNALADYQQHKEIISSEKGTLLIKHKDLKAEIVQTKDITFVVEQDQIRKLEKNKLINSNREEFEKTLESEDPNQDITISLATLKALEKALGKFEII